LIRSGAVDRFRYVRQEPILKGAIDLSPHGFHDLAVAHLKPSVRSILRRV
jgi:hypothetical protein